MTMIHDPVIFRYQFLKQILMIALDQDQIAGSHLLQNEVLHFLCFSPTVEEISEDHKPVRFLLRKVSGLLQGSL